MKKNKMFYSALALAIATPSFVHVSAASTATQFKDISTNSFGYDAITNLVSKQVIYGYSDGTFKSNQAVTRGQFATFIARALNLPTGDSNFKDLPKSKSLYADVSRAAKAGIILGDTKGNIFPDKEVTRAEVAVMVDRALTLKGSYTKQKDLVFTDSKNIPSFALESVKRMAYYGIVAGKGNNTFSPNETANRAESSVFIFRMLNLLDSEIITPGPEIPAEPEKEYPKGDIRNFSYDELVADVGTWEVIQRSGGDGSITVIDAVKEMREDIFKLPNDAPALLLSPKEYFDSYIRLFKQGGTYYAQAYPLFEFTAINGVPYRHTDYYPSFLENPEFVQEIRLNNNIPNPPKENGKFLIDLPGANRDVVTYENSKVKTERISAIAKYSNGEVYTDIKGLFNDTTLVDVASDGLTIQFGDKTLNLQLNSNEATLNNQKVTLNGKVYAENGNVYVPMKSVANELGIYWRQMDLAKRWEFANYPLEKDILGWEE